MGNLAECYRVTGRLDRCAPLYERALKIVEKRYGPDHPETALTGDGLVVFPSNEQLSLRAHGMSATTLRRQLTALVDGGLAGEALLPTVASQTPADLG